MTVGLNGLIGLALAVPGMRFLLDPMRGRRTKSEFLRVARLSALTPGRPSRVVVAADRWDAYIHHPPGPIGSVWVIRSGDDAETTEVRCLQTICPHLGCGITFATDRETFTCPCHTSDFDVTGLRRLGPSLRDMDELACRVTEPDAQGERWVEVQYVEFHTGIATRRSIV